MTEAEARALPVRARLELAKPWLERNRAYRQSRRRAEHPPIWCYWDGPCYCDKMPPDQSCHSCIENHIPLPPAPCELGLWPHRWRRYVTGNVYGSRRANKAAGGTRMRACKRCHKTEERRGGRTSGRISA